MNEIDDHSLAVSIKVGISQFDSQRISVYLTGKKNPNNDPNKTPNHHQIDILTGSLSRKKPLGLSKQGGFTRHPTFGSGSSAGEPSHCSRDSDMCDSAVSPLYFPHAHRMAFWHSRQLKPLCRAELLAKRKGVETEREK